MAFFRYKNREIKKGRESSKNEASDEPGILKLIDKAAHGDAKAFGKLYDTYLDRVYRYVYYHVKDVMIAEDLTEEIFVKAWEAIDRYQWRGQPFSSWLFRIAHNHVMDFHRSTKKEAMMKKEVSVVTSEPREDIERKVMQEELLKAISGLTPLQKEVITLKFIEGWDNHQIAEVLGKNEGAIRVAQMRGLAALRKSLSREIEG